MVEVVVEVVVEVGVEVEVVMKCTTLTPAMEHWLESAPYEDLVARFLFAQPGNPFFLGANSDYYFRIMDYKRACLPKQEVQAIHHAFLKGD